MVTIHVGALARDGQANLMLVDYLSKLLKINNNNVLINIGLRSKIKTINIRKNGLTPQHLKDLLTQEISEQKPADSVY